jgi:hypothetical protein
MAETFKTPVCDECGSQNIWADACAKFDPVTGEWWLSSVYDYTECNDCMNECRVEWKEMEQMT